MMKTNNVVLISKRMIDEEGIESFDTFFARILSISEDSLIVQRLDTQEEVDLPPYDSSLYIPAEKGFYELENGEVFENPDYIGEFVVYKSKEAWERYGD